MNSTDIVKSIIVVGSGRGFVIEVGHERYVITAAHCLPQLPPAHPASYTEERTYARLLGPLDGEQTVWAECMFVDPIADLAVLGPPDGQALYEEAEAYDVLMDSAVPLPIGELPLPAKRDPEAIDCLTTLRAAQRAFDRIWGENPGFVVSLDVQLVPCILGYSVISRAVAVKDEKIVVSGMSGSPIFNESGQAVAVISVDTLNSRLAMNLPGWLLRDLGG
jgi:hypothetical protein